MKKSIVEDYLVIDDYVPKSLQDEIEETLLSLNFPWFIFSEIWTGGNDIQSRGENVNIINSPGLVHNFVNEGIFGSNHCHFFTYILHFLSKDFKFSVDELLRIRGRVTFPYPNVNRNTFCGPHVDYSMMNDYYSLIYYVNDSDGDTFLFDQRREDSSFKPDLSNLKIVDRISPKKGRLLLFNGNILHSGNCPINSNIRCIVNYDFTVE